VLNNKALAKIAVYGGVIAIGSACWMKIKIEDRLRDQPFFKLALKQLQEHPGAIQFLGKPIKDRALNLHDNENNFCYEGKAQFQVAVNGPLNKGTLYFWAELDKENKNWEVKRSELELADQPDKRLVIVKAVEELSSSL
jgi:cytochrome c oxidase assembly factor 1